MRRLLLATVLTAMAASVGIADDKADALKKLEPVVKKARKIAAEYAEEEPFDTTTIFRLLEQINPVEANTLKGCMARRNMGLEHKSGQTRGEFAKKSGLFRLIVKRAVFYYDDDDFLDVVLKYNPTPDAVLFMDLAESWTISDFRARKYILDTIQGKPGDPEHESHAKKLIAELSKKKAG